MTGSAERGCSAGGPCSLGELLWTTGKYSDVVVVVEDDEKTNSKKLQLHRLILEAATYWKTLFSERWAPGATSFEARLAIEGESAEAIGAALRLMYVRDFGSALRDFAAAASLYRVSSFLVWEEGLRESTRFAISLVARETMGTMREAAEALAWEELLAYCTAFTHATESNIFTEGNLAKLLDMALQQNLREAQLLCETEFRENERLGRAEVTRRVLLGRVSEASLVSGNNLCPGVSWFQQQLLLWIEVPLLLKTWTAFKVSLSRLSNQLALFALALMERCSAEEGACLERACPPLTVDEAHEILGVWSPYIQNASGQLFGATVLRYAYHHQRRGLMDVEELERIVRKHLSSGFPVRCGPETVAALVRILTTVDSRHRGRLVNAVVHSCQAASSALTSFGPDLLAALVWCQEQEKCTVKREPSPPAPASGPDPPKEAEHDPAAAP
eukprot:tig00000718_g3723.t1